ncbi:MAG: DUF4840 domain-containing protein [Prevotella sp.]|nr:DUF4840 domain-containing protein [Prevotella sp.]
MRQLFVLAVVAALLVACDNSPVFHGMTQQQKETYSNAIAGEYTGRNIFIYNNGTDDATAVKVEGARMTITAQSMQVVMFHDFPISVLSNVVTDPALAEALATVPNQDILATYSFFNLQDNGDVNWGYEPAAIPLKLHYGGTDHHLTLKLSNGRVYYGLMKVNMDAGNPFGGNSIFDFSIDAIYDGDTLVQDFDRVWQDNDHYIITYFQKDE